MSTRNLIDAIASGSALDIESAFEDTMAEKVSVQIEAKRLQIAQTMFTTEEVDLDEEQLDELSKKTLGSYIKKATDSNFADPRTIGNLSSKSTEKDIRSGGEDGGEEEHKAKMRSKGVAKAVNRLTKEEVDLDEEQLDELSPKTLGSYVKNAHQDQKERSFSAGYNNNETDKEILKDKKRDKNISKAVNKLVHKANEELDLDEEQLDELSKGTLDSYRDAAVDHTDKIKKHVASMNQQVKSSTDMVKHYKTGSVADAHRGHVNDAKSELKTSKRLLKNRAAGIDRAGEKLAKNEEVDLDEDQSEQE